MWSATFWKDAVERAVKTTAQVLVAQIAAWTIVVGETDWEAILLGTGVAAGLSFLTSILSSLAGSSSSASVVD